MDCLFCKIANKEIPADIIYNNEDFAVFKDINPKAPVHLLLVPKRHIESINHLGEGDKELMGDLFLLAKKMAKEQDIDAGYRLTINVGRQGGQVIDHLHLHLMGKFS